MNTFLRLLFLACLLLPQVQTPLSNASDLPAPGLLLAKVYHDNTPLKKYWVSEKLDGVRAYWNGKELVSRQGNIYHAPKWFIANFPKTPLDGELWIGHHQFEKLSGIARKKIPVNSEWRQVSYQIFDMPPETDSPSLPFSRRLDHLKGLIPSLNIHWLKLIPQYKLPNEAALQEKLQLIVAQGGEGLMLHRGDSLYQTKRSDDLLKLKPHFDSEALVIKHLPGKGKYTGMLGSIKVQTPEGLQFRIGTGFSDQERESPPAIGSIITYRYRGKTRNGVPRFASFLRIREQY